MLLWGLLVMIAVLAILGNDVLLYFKHGNLEKYEHSWSSRSCWHIIDLMWNFVVQSILSYMQHVGLSWLIIYVFSSLLWMIH